MGGLWKLVWSIFTHRDQMIDQNMSASKHNSCCFEIHGNSYGVIEAKEGSNPPIMPVVMTPGGSLDLSTVLFRNRIIFIGQSVNSAVAQKVISQLVTLATIDENADILVLLCFSINVLLDFFL